MDHNRNIDNFPHCSLLLLSFFKQKGCQNSELRRELDDFDLLYDHNYNESDGDLQTDGHSSSADYKDLSHELQNEVHPQLPADAEQAQAAREIAAELIRIADLLEQRVLYQAADTLTKKLNTCDPQLWSRHLSDGVQSLLHQVAGAKEFKKELVEMALTFVLMKTVCERVPQFLSRLYGTVVQYFGSR